MNKIKQNSLEITKDRLGRNIWILLHSSAAALKTNEEVKTFKNMWESMVKIFPCPECKGHLVKMLKDPTLSNKYKDSNTPQDINIWLWDVHNRVNRRLNKKIFSPVDDNQIKTITTTHFKRGMNRRQIQQSQLKDRNEIAKINSEIMRSNEVREGINKDVSKLIYNRLCGLWGLSNVCGCRNKRKDRL